jgi:hypothetical protein
MRSKNEAGAFRNAIPSCEICRPPLYATCVRQRILCQLTQWQVKCRAASALPTWFGASAILAERPTRQDETRAARQTHAVVDGVHVTNERTAAVRQSGTVRRLPCKPATAGRLDPERVLRKSKQLPRDGRRRDMLRCHDHREHAPENTAGVEPDMPESIIGSQFSFDSRRMARRRAFGQGYATTHDEATLFGPRIRFGRRTIRVSFSRSEARTHERCLRRSLPIEHGRFVGA